MTTRRKSCGEHFIFFLCVFSMGITAKVFFFFLTRSCGRKSFEEGTEKANFHLGVLTTKKKHKQP